MKLGLCISLFLAGYLYSCPVVAQKHCGSTERNNNKSNDLQHL